MTVTFNPESAFIPITVHIRGPRGNTSALVALDTGATMTWLSRNVLAELEYDLTSPVDLMEVTTASGRQVSPIVSIFRIVALGLGLERIDFPIICQDLPAGTPFDGLLGLDFFSNQRLTIDFPQGLISLD